MNTRKFPRTAADAFKTGPEYGCAIERPRTGHRAAIQLLIDLSIAVIATAVIVFVVFAAVGYWSA